MADRRRFLLWQDFTDLPLKPGLMPGERKVVRVLGDHAAGTVTARPWYSPHATKVSWGRRLRSRRSDTAKVRGEAMEKKIFGKTGLDVTRLSLGARARGELLGSDGSV